VTAVLDTNSSKVDFKLIENVTEVNVSDYLKSNSIKLNTKVPVGSWVSLKNFSDVLELRSVDNKDLIEIEEMGENSSLINTHMMPGTIVAQEDNGMLTYLNFFDIFSIKSSLQLFINRDSIGKA
jgi:hypothetical protein